MMYETERKDRIGRKPALILSVVMMAVPTGLIAVLPTYAAIGVAAPLLLTLLRLLQGLSVGGEYTGSIVFLTEQAPKDRRGLVGSAGLISGNSGVLLASAIATVLTTALPADVLEPRSPASGRTRPINPRRCSAISGQGPMSLQKPMSRLPWRLIPVKRYSVKPGKVYSFR